MRASARSARLLHVLPGLLHAPAPAGLVPVASSSWWGAGLTLSIVAWGNSESEVAQSCLTLRPRGLYSPRGSLGQNTGVGSLSRLQGIFPTQGLNSGFPHHGQILNQLSHQGSPRILGWVAIAFSSRSY